jgi:hypothetical protein
MVLTSAEIARLDEIEGRLGERDDPPTAFLDPDVRAWPRAKGPRYQAEVNRILWERMLAEE